VPQGKQRAGGQDKATAGQANLVLAPQKKWKEVMNQAAISAGSAGI
jgi:hypothetical protein